MAKVTKIEAQKRNKERVNIYLDGEYAFSVYAELIYKEKINTNMEIDKDKLDSIISEANYLKCKETSLRIITRSYKTELEMKNRLIEKGYNIKEIDRTIDFLKEYNFINDKDYIAMYLKDKINNRGIDKIKYELIRKGISEEDIGEAINNADCEKEAEAAYNIGLKKYRQLITKEDNSFKIKSKLANHLMSKGYNYSLVKATIDKIIDIEKGGDVWN
jgi:regulatory protein